MPNIPWEVILTLSVLSLALGMDSFSVGLGLGMQKLRLWYRFKIAIVIGLFHTVMPFAGMVTGKLASGWVGAMAEQAGGSLLVLLGAHMLYQALRPQPSQMWTMHRGIGLWVLGASVSVDALSVGVSLGLIGGLALGIALFIGVVGGLMALAGMSIGHHLSDRLGAWSEWCEALGGLILIAIGLQLIL